MEENMSILMRFPDFKYKAFTLSYDDGATADNRLCDLFYSYGVKATFNLCTSLIGKPDRLTEQDIKERIIERGFELACHGDRHTSLALVDNGVAMLDTVKGRSELEERFGIIVKGMAYANGSFDKDTVEMLRLAGIEHCRTTVSTGKFTMPDEPLAMPATCKHTSPDLMKLAREFIETPLRSYYWAKTPRLFYVWGHAFEFDNDNNWEVMEELLKYVSGREDVWYATVGEIISYQTAFKSLRQSMDGKIIHNPSAIPVYVHYHGKDIVIEPGKTVTLEG